MTFLILLFLSVMETQSLPWGCGKKQGTDVEGIQVAESAPSVTGKLRRVNSKHTAAHPRLLELLGLWSERPVREGDLRCVRGGLIKKVAGR